jgi:hypothetical protein
MRVANCVMQPDRTAQIAVYHACPVTDVLRMQRQVEPILMPQSAYIRWRCTLSEHRQNGVAGNKMNQ